MSAREAIEKIVGRIHGLPPTGNQGVHDCIMAEKVLREGGWHHEDDVVEGRNACREFNFINKCHPDCCRKQIDCNGCAFDRPATIKDLIGKGE